MRGPIWRRRRRLVAMQMDERAIGAADALLSEPLHGSVPSAVRRGRGDGKGLRVLIEQAMYFALGFLVAGLLTLMFLPAFWRRALRLSMRRLQMLAPMSMEEVVAERDLLRAEFAVRERRLEQEIEAVKTARAGALAESGRRAAHIIELETRIKSAEADCRDMNQRVSEAQRIVAERSELLLSTEMALHELTERVESLSRLEPGGEAFDLERQAPLNRVAAHEATMLALHERNAEMAHAVEAMRADYAQAAAAIAKATGLEQELARVSAELETMRTCGQSLAAELDTTRAELKTAQERYRNDGDHYQNALRAARAETRDKADKLESARADTALLQGAVEALRANLRRGGNGAHPASGGDPASESDVAALREAIVQFGDQVAALDPGGAADKTTVKRAL